MGAKISPNGLQGIRFIIVVLPYLLPVSSKHSDPERVSAPRKWACANLILRGRHYLQRATASLTLCASREEDRALENLICGEGEAEMRGGAACLHILKRHEKRHLVKVATRCGTSSSAILRVRAQAAGKNESV